MNLLFLTIITGFTQHAQIRSATREVSSALRLADTRFTCFQHKLRVRLVKAALHSHSR